MNADTDLIRLSPERLSAVRATGLLDSEVEEVFDRLTRLAVRIVGVPAAFISLVDADRDFYKSACGFGEPLASARELAGPTFCHFTLQRSTPLVIPDTAADPVYRDVPTVRTLGVAAYVGIPLVVGGQPVGAFCVIDTVPRSWTDEQVEVLVELAASAQREMELRGAIVTARTAMALLETHRDELAYSNAQLQEQAVELELQAEALHATTAHLEERTAEAEEANKAKSDFLSMMSHELRTPLNAIGGYAELIKIGVRGAVTPQQQEFLDRIQRAARHLETLITDILEFAHLDAGQMRFNLGDVDVDAVIGESVELLHARIIERGVVFSHESCAGTRRIRADTERLRQILVNLLANAIKFTPPAGRVWVACELHEDRMSIRVGDTGRGIPDGALARIFEPFVQVDRGQTAPQDQGVGLGLAICRTLARGMDGELTAESIQGEGSVFTLVLPTSTPTWGASPSGS